MEIIEEEYDPSSEECDDSGSIYRFIEGNKEYLFNIESAIPDWASSQGAVIDGIEVKIFVHQPYGDNKKVIQIPTHCSVFLEAMKILKAMGVKHVGFYNRVSGGFSSFKIQSIIDGALEKE